MARAGRPCPAGPAGPGARRPASESLFAISDLLGDKAVGRASRRDPAGAQGGAPAAGRSALPPSDADKTPDHSLQAAGFIPRGKELHKGPRGPGHRQSPRPRPGPVPTQGMFAESINDHLNYHPETVQRAPCSLSPSLMCRHSRGRVEGSGPGRCLQRRSAGNVLPRREPQGGAPGRLPGSARGSASSLSICLTEGAGAFGFLATPQELAGFSRGAHSPVPPPPPPPPRFRDLKSLQRPQRTTGKMT